MQPPSRRLCNGHCKSGKPCEGPAVTGSDKCRMHMGKKTEPTIEAGKVEEKARKLFGKLVPDIKPVDNPLAAYSMFAGRVMTWVEVMDAQLEELSVVGYQHEKAGEQVKAAVQLYAQAMTLANQVLSAYARLKIDERLAAITEAQQTVILSAFDAGLEEIGIDEDMRAAAVRAVASRLRGKQRRHLRAV
jgi:hypothetical protein